MARFNDAETNGNVEMSRARLGSQPSPVPALPPALFTVPWMSLPAWYDGEGLPNWGLVLGGPPPPVLEEVTALCRSSIRRCWLDLCGQAYRAGSVAHGAAAAAAAAAEDEGVWDEADTEQCLDLDQLLVLTQSVSSKLELESTLFHPVFAQYAPQIAELATAEWGQVMALTCT